MNKVILSLVAAMSLSACAAQAVDKKATESLEKQLAPFPKAEKNQVRHVIELDKIDNEDNYQVELIVGKEIMVDCNHQSFGAELKSKDLEGWGYNYYVVSDLKGPMSTLMGCMDNTKKPAFVSAFLGQDAFTRYNSKLPIVVYAPTDVDVKYRIWSTNGEMKDTIQK
ncbi:serine protease inhibitor ecotin [Proteus myxofaciens]|uniref:Ecotin n=1 Tax=Proteus myxofaciens ATCC 19692 TaxID=1354337 RepID=A0A198GE16_9GAMM|nr:serine protease inhibitor ecotin [Proteus myxofaciens]OAT35034.1 ecotin [Proteus myxofaciens ATCC 19692]